MPPNSRSGNATDPRVRRTRKLIERAFDELLSEKGFEALTVQEITDRATVNRATFSAHFEDKYSLLDNYIRESFQECLAATVPASAALSAANMRHLTEAVCSYLEPLQGAQHCRTSDRQALEPLVVTAMQEELYGFLLDRLQNRACSGSDTAGKRTPETIATVMSSAIFGAGLQWARGDTSQSVEVVTSQAVEVLVAGLSGIVAAPEAVVSRLRI